MADSPGMINREAGDPAGKEEDNDLSLDLDFGFLFASNESRSSTAV